MFDSATPQSDNVTDGPAEDENELPDSRPAVGWLTVFAALSICLYGIISLLSWRFDHDSVTTERPIIAVLCLFAFAFAAYVGAIVIVWRDRPHSSTLKLIIAAAVVFRVVMLFSLPIQEVDIYRYLWDGAVSTAGVSPFQHSPQSVSAAVPTETDDVSLQRLVELRDRHPAIAETLHRVHFPELPTIYPPTGQVVFAAASLTTPPQASLLTRLFIMKAWFVGFDLATLMLVIAILRLSQKPAELCVIYAWCPLLMKEVANSGHCDAVAVFVTTLTVYLAIRLANQRKPRAGFASLGYVLLIGWVLALAVGAKLYPVVLAPLLFLALARNIGWRFTLASAALFAITTVLLLSFLAPATHPNSNPELSDDQPLAVITFLRRWEMNDFIFQLMIQNFKPTAQRSPHEVAWFTIMPESARTRMVDSIASQFKVAPGGVPFLVTRALTATIFFAVALTIAWQADPKDVPRFCESAFLTIAWFWLLCPTQNPWYWTWALPLLPFARNRVWLAVSGLVFIYYLRFSLTYHFPDTAVLGTRYTGAAFYDFVVTWIEFAPWFVALFVSFVLRRYPTQLLNATRRYGGDLSVHDG